MRRHAGVQLSTLVLVRCLATLQDDMGKIGRLSLPWALFAYPFYLWKRSPGKVGSHYDPECDLFVEAERNQVGCSGRFGRFVAGRVVEWCFRNCAAGQAGGGPAKERLMAC